MGRPAGSNREGGGHLKQFADLPQLASSVGCSVVELTVWWFVRVHDRISPH